MSQYEVVSNNGMTLMRMTRMSQDPINQKKDRRGKNGDGDERHDVIYRTISDAIIEHRLKPGARLREDALSDVFGISRTGIRKILQRLAHGQMVTLTPRRGASVTRPTAEEARDVFQARRLIEGGLVPIVMANLTPQAIKELKEIAGQECEALRKKEQSAAIRLSAAFHECLARLSFNEVLVEYVTQLCSRSSLILAVYGNTGHLGCESHDHAELIKLLEKGDAKNVGDFMDHHLKAIEASLSFVEAADKAPDLRHIFST